MQNFLKKINTSEKSIWRYAKLLEPGHEIAKKNQLGRGFKWTKLELAARDLWGSRQGGLFFKREDQAYLGSHKIRSLGYQISSLKEAGVKEAALSTTGNAGISAAYYCKKAGIKLTIFVNRNISAAKLAAMQKFHPIIVKSSQEGSELEDFLQKNKAVFDLRPSRDDKAIFGMKSLGFEIFEQMPRIDRNTAIFLFVSSGGGILGLYQAFQDLMRLQELRNGRPQLHCVQKAPINFAAAYFDKKNRAEKSLISAPEIASIQRRSKAIIEAVKKTGGHGWEINNLQFEAAQKKMERAGVIVTDEAVMAYAGYVRAVEEKYNFKTSIVILSGKKW